jgi:inosine-uridine nucleoside N-ribohydrolase
VQSPSGAPIPIIIDTDPGIDDALALWLALHSPELDVRGLSVSCGNTTVEHAYRNCVELLRRAGRRLTLAVGARRPLRRPLAVGLETHGESGLGYAAVPKAGVILDWVQPFERLLADQPGPVTLVTLGPLTSLARALRREREMVEAKVARHVAMAGALDGGNTTRYSEFNAWCDPEALDIVLRSDLDTEFVTLDATRQVVLKGSEVAALEHAGDAMATWFHDALRFYHEFHRAHGKRDACVIHDVVAIAALIRPGVVSFESRQLVVDLASGDHRGHTRITPDGTPARVATAVRADAVRALLFERVLPWVGAPDAGAVS